MKLIKGILFCLIYTIGYVFLALASTGGGHGNFIVMVPVNITWAFNFAALILLTQLKYKITQFIFVILMLVYYGLLLFMLAEASTHEKMLTNYAALLIPTLWFLSGQVIIWAVFFKKLKGINSIVRDY
ncbi:MAG: hypothetical protein M3209_06770 [Acidobacteriota bacterium]|nr:hypothetical protein [Acidobacteriota bacterium]